MKLVQNTFTVDPETGLRYFSVVTNDGSALITLQVSDQDADHPVSDKSLASDLDSVVLRMLKTVKESVG